MREQKNPSSGNHEEKDSLMINAARIIDGLHAAVFFLTMRGYIKPHG